MTLQARAVTFAYGRRAVLEEVSLDLQERGLHGLVGPNGSGKSTFLGCLYGALRPNSGRIRLDECDLGRVGRREIARAIGVVPQRCNPAFPVSVRYFVSLGRFAREPLFGGSTRADDEVVSACLEELALADLADRPVDQLSGGEFRRVLIAQALAQEPRILLLDEPVQQLDLLHQLEVMEFVRDFARRSGTAALIVLHDLGLAARYCDTITLLHRGRLVASGPPAQIFTPDHLRRVWGVEASIERSPVTGALQITALREARER